MKKSPWGFVRWLAGGIRLAMTRPYSDKNAKLNVGVWGFLLGITLMNVTMAVLLGTMSSFLIGFNLVGLVVYTACLRWAFQGLLYRARVRREESDRISFDQIVAGL